VATGVAITTTFAKVAVLHDTKPYGAQGPPSSAAPKAPGRFFPYCTIRFFVLPCEKLPPARYAVLE
jgi:hypothetical protein